MSELLPAKVESRSEQIAVRDAVVGLIAWAETTDDLVGLKENMRRDEALQKLVDDKDTIQALCRGMRWLEVHVGRALGMDVEPGERPSPASEGNGLFSKDDRHKFRQMARWTIGQYRTAEIVELVDTGAARNQILRRIAELTPRGEGEDLWEGMPETWHVAHADFREFCAAIPDESVDLIITDPPYPKEHLDLYADMAEIAARILQPRGLCFITTGQLFFPDVLERLGRHLTYGWTFMLDLPGVNSRVMPRHLIQTWKPILVYSTGTWPSGTWRADRVVSPAKDQSLHAWAQNSEPARDLIAHYSRPNALVLDPFCGAGSYGWAALQERRRFLGIDIHADAVQQARERLASCV